MILPSSGWRVTDVSCVSGVDCSRRGANIIPLSATSPTTIYYDPDTAQFCLTLSPAFFVGDHPNAYPVVRPEFPSLIDRFYDSGAVTDLPSCFVEFQSLHILNNRHRLFPKPCTGDLLTVHSPLRGRFPTGHLDPQSFHFRLFARQFGRALTE